jgi:integrase/recombinase XerD
VLKNWIKKAEIEKNISFYCGRHTYAVNLLKNGANLKTVSDAMGHSNTRHTVKYLNYVDSLKDTATSNLNF